MRTVRQLTSSLFLVTGLLFLAACGDGGKAHVTLKLTDAPGDTFEKAVVTISKVYLKGHVDGQDGKGDVVLLSEPVTTDLLTLANDTADLVKDAEVPPGTYKELRFVITGGYIQVKQDGTSRIFATSRDYAGLPAGAQVDGDLQMPSASSSGLKVKFDKDADVTITSDDNQKVILVDFDVAQSFGKEAGGSGKWVMRPVIKGADLQFSGNVEVSLEARDGLSLPLGLPQLGTFKAVLINADGSRESLAFTAASGTRYVADFKYLLPGTYQVDLETVAGVTFSTDLARPATTQVSSGAEADVHFVLTSYTVE
ncbi:DUF4382 domain-containing protein [Corallococcus sp. Z5C101001]|uniref:DUF4382 domain-containing protein n=1 Tax=Corallococcus sp. Z5C101001 TaxID=2596829 RepID=UPI00117DBF07|nr:DUF4382 domain-containing protein [Corallococcus sp. Z5C101001]TSC31733.1 DUF4382 domain-containing protein [Corallococcus sp. Z5C101001]